jgi:hypothetical protein
LYDAQTKSLPGFAEQVLIPLNQNTVKTYQRAVTKALSLILAKVLIVGQVIEREIAAGTRSTLVRH